MLATKTYQVLDALKIGEVPKGLERDVVEYMVGKELVETISTGEYETAQEQAEILDTVTRDVVEYNGLVSDSQREVDELRNLTTSKWHRFWTSEFKLFDEERRLERNSEELSGYVSKRDELLEQQRIAISSQRKILGMTSTSQGYLRPTHLGIERTSQLGARLSELEGVSYEDAEQQIIEYEEQARKARRRREEDDRKRRREEEEERRRRNDDDSFGIGSLIGLSDLLD